MTLSRATTSLAIGWAWSDVDVRRRTSTSVDALKIEHGSILSAFTDVNALGVNAHAF